MRVMTPGCHSTILAEILLYQAQRKWPGNMTRDTVRAQEVPPRPLFPVQVPVGWCDRRAVNHLFNLEDFDKTSQLNLGEIRIVSLVQTQKLNDSLQCLVSPDNLCVYQR
jgi:hypothetical protein